MIDWSKQPFAAHQKLMNDLLKQIETEWQEMSWWKKAWIRLTQKENGWKKRQLIKRYKMPPA